MRELAQRATASPHWRWMPGMIAGCGGRRARARRKGGPPYRGALPDLTDPATLGCLLALVREAWGDKFLVPQEDYCHKALWCIRGRTGMPAWVAVACMSEAEALIAALEAAPCESSE